MLKQTLARCFSLNHWQSLKKMRKFYIFILTFGLLSCDNGALEQTKNQPDVATKDATLTETTNAKLQEEMTVNEKDTLIDKKLVDQKLMDEWTWGEGPNAIPAKKSSIQNFPYSSNLLLHKWKFGDDQKPILEFTDDSMNVYIAKYIYTIKFDSLRVYTQAEHPNGGINRGIITKLTKDTLVVEWSTNDRDIYITYNE